MSGIPPLGGFFVKLDVLAALIDSSRFYTNYILFFFTVASFFYYLRLVKIIFFDEEKGYSKPVAKNEERLKMNLFVNAQINIVNADENTDVELPLQIINNNTSIPALVILYDKVVSSKNIPDEIAV